MLNIEKAHKFAYSMHTLLMSTAADVDLFTTPIRRYNSKALALFVDTYPCVDPLTGSFTTHTHAQHTYKCNLGNIEFIHSLTGVYVCYMALAFCPLPARSYSILPTILYASL